MSVKDKLMGVIRSSDAPPTILRRSVVTEMSTDIQAEVRASIRSPECGVPILTPSPAESGKSSKMVESLRLEMVQPCSPPRQVILIVGFPSSGSIETLEAEVAKRRGCPPTLPSSLSCILTTKASIIP